MWNLKLFKFCVKIGSITFLLLFSLILLVLIVAIRSWLKLSISEFSAMFVILLILEYFILFKYVLKYSPNHNARIWLFAGKFNKNCCVHIFKKIPDRKEVEELIFFAIEIASTTNKCKIIYDSPLLVQPKRMQKLIKIVQKVINKTTPMNIEVKNRRLNFFERIVFILGALFFKF